MIASLEGIAADLDGVGLDSADAREVAGVAGHGRAVLDEVAEPRLLTGDLWTVNALLERDADVPAISGVLDFDRCLFGAPEADWTIRMARAKDDGRTAFREAHGRLDRSAAVRRSRVYAARHLGAIRPERHRLGRADAVREGYGTMAGLLAGLR
ncbi:hypothetical protein [Streptomyces sp. NPDC096105]|uniref:hypothetical protein n=1 Tax=Streptomyces sp. NPDC096105 TaxID=3366074 RepID=UPI003802AF4E